MIKIWWHRLTTKRVAFMLASYCDADELLAKGWELAKEEDNNYMPGVVYLERRE